MWFKDEMGVGLVGLEGGFVKNSILKLVFGSLVSIIVVVLFLGVWFLCWLDCMVFLLLCYEI